MMLAFLLAGATLDVVFLPEVTERPAVVVAVEQEGTRREISWAILSSPPITGTLADERGTASSLLPLPQAPQGASVIESGGALVITIHDAGAWQDPFIGAAPRGRGAPVAGESALRLVITANGDGVTEAEVVGSRARVAGKAFVSSKKPSASAVVRAGKEITAGAGAAIASTEACGKVVPTAISIPSSSLKLTAGGEPACAGSLAIVGVSGVQVGGKKDTPVVGVVLTR